MPASASAAIRPAVNASTIMSAAQASSMALVFLRTRCRRASGVISQSSSAISTNTLATPNANSRRELELNGESGASKNSSATAPMAAMAIVSGRCRYCSMIRRGAVAGGSPDIT